MFLIDKIAEQKITESIQRGELDDLPGMGRPIDLEDEVLVPEDLRVGYRMLKNAGYLPPAVHLRKEIQSVDTLIVQARSEEERQILSRRLRYLQMQLSIANPNAAILTESYYLDKL